MPSNAIIILPNGDQFIKIVGGENSQADKANDAQMQRLSDAQDYIASLSDPDPVVSSDKKKINWASGNSSDKYSAKMEITGTNLSIDKVELDTFSISGLSYRLYDNSDTSLMGSVAIGMDLNVIEGHIKKFGITSFAFQSGNVSFVNRGAIMLDAVNERFSMNAALSVNLLSGAQEATKTINNFSFSGKLNVDFALGTLSGTLNSVSIANGYLNDTGVFKPSGEENSLVLVTGLDVDLERLLNLPEDASDDEIGAIIFSGPSDSLTSGEDLLPLPEGIEKVTLSGADNLSVTGNKSANTIIGNSGNNTINGGGGADTMTGGAGNDTYYVDHSNDRVIEKSGEGTDVVYAEVSYILPSAVENLVLQNDSIAIYATGNSLNNRIRGNEEGNVLFGGDGADSMDGGNGDDIYLINSTTEHTSADRIRDTGTSGVDAVRFASTVKGATLTIDSTFSGIERIEIGTGKGLIPANPSGTTALNVNASAYAASLKIVGNYGPNTMTGTRFDDELSGERGSDTLDGGDGSDDLDGGKGADTLTGGGSTDYFQFELGDSGQSTGFDVITDFKKGGWGAGGDIITFDGDSMSIGGSRATATSSRASIHATKAVATFASGSGGTLSDALSDIATSFTAAGNDAGQFALFQIGQSGDYYVFISDGKAGVGSNDIVIRLAGVNAVGGVVVEDWGAFYLSA